jgi:nitrogen fixation NifU-like protein
MLLFQPLPIIFCFGPYAVSPEEVFEKVVLPHWKNPQNSYVMPDADVRGRSENALCGDTISIYAKVDSCCRIQRVSFQAQACAVVVASASIMTTDLKGTDFSEALHRIGLFLSGCTLRSNLDRDFAFSDIVADLVQLRAWPSRLKCLRLPWFCFRNAIDSASTT